MFLPLLIIIYYNDYQTITGSLNLKGHSQLWDRADLDTSFAGLKKVYLNLKSTRHMWVELVVGSLPCSERFFSGYSGFPLSLNSNSIWNTRTRFNELL